MTLPATVASIDEVVFHNGVNYMPSFKVPPGAFPASPDGWQTSNAPEITYAPSGTTDPTPGLVNRYFSLDLTAATDLTVTLTVPPKSSTGSFVIIQHGTTPVDVTWAVSAGSLTWAGLEPTWANDPVSSKRVIPWRYDGSVLHLTTTEVFV